MILCFTRIACNEDGNDGDENSEPTACEVNGHDWKDADCDTPQTCSVCSATEGSALGHDYTVTDKNDSQHWKKCSVCGAIDESSRASHTGGVATCTAKAKCSVCGEEYGSLDLNNHDYQESIVKKPSTFEKGEKKFTCACGDNYTEDIPATKSLELLAIGNSFSQDAFEHLYIICKDAGIEELVLGHLYIGGCSLETHYQSMSTDANKYIFYLSSATQNGMVDHFNGVKTNAEYGIKYTDWDYITLQQNSANSGDAPTYEYLDDVIAYVKQHVTNENVQFFWHMTWAYQANSSHSSFPKYDNDQLKMYNAILSCISNEVLTNPDIKGVVPSGTTIQNLRTSHLGDTLTRDGHHLSKGIGRYAAALTYLAAITGYDVSSIDAIPSDYSSVADHLGCMKEAVKNAIATPYAVTPSVDYPYVEQENNFNATLSPLTEADKTFLTEKGYDPSLYMLLDITFFENAYYQSNHSDNYSTPFNPDSSHDYYFKFITTQLFTKSELINGTLIRIKEGYEYRPEGWIALNEKVESGDRPTRVSAEHTVVDAAWWGDWNYRAFNVQTKDASEITDAGQTALRIYVKIA